MSPLVAVRTVTADHRLDISISTAASDVRILLIKIRVTRSTGAVLFSSVSAMKAPLPLSTFSPNSRAADNEEREDLPHLQGSHQHAQREALDDFL